MTEIIAISGSLRSGSFNTALIKAVSDMFPDEIKAESISGIPLYNADLEESEGIPGQVTDLKEKIASADGLLVATPEYNNSMPGVLKNAVDWLSRPPSDISRVFHDKPVAIIGASPGGFGTVSAQSAWLPVLRTLKTRPYWAGRLMVSRVAGLVDDDGKLSDEDTLERLEKFVGGFIKFCNS